MQWFFGFFSLVCAGVAFSYFWFVQLEGRVPICFEMLVFVFRSVRTAESRCMVAE
jgi:hypothetical protein